VKLHNSRQGKNGFPSRHPLAWHFSPALFRYPTRFSFFRLASFRVGNECACPALTLAAFLLGVASGRNARRNGARIASRAPDLPADILRLLLLNGMLGLLILPALSLSAPLGNGVLGVIMLLTFLIARSLGIVFPLLAHFSVLPDRRSGGRIGLVLLADILGSAAGSMLTGFVLADVLGTRDLAILLSLLSFAIVIPFAWLGAHRLKTSKIRLGAALTAACGLIVFQGALSARAMESMLYKAQAKDHPPLARIVENRDGIIAVSPDGTFMAEASMTAASMSIWCTISTALSALSD